MGDYRPPVSTAHHRISVNHNLNPYDFLITLVHEIAHLIVWKEYGNKVKPHGKEWKRQFRQLMEPFLGNDIFPPDLEGVLNKYLARLSATRISDTELSKKLQEYDTLKKGIYLEELPENALFSIPGGRTFRKLEKLRKRYRCMNLETRRTYLISPIFRVVPLDGTEQ
jgi:SprT protein